MKKLISATMIGVLAVAICTGCGAVPQKEATTEGAKKVQSEDTKEKADSTALTELAASRKVFLTENSIFFAACDGPDDNRHEDYLVQCDLQGKEINSFYLDEKLVGVGKGYICYCKYGEKKDLLYTAPIEKTSEGESVNMKKAEKIAGGLDFAETGAYVWESYIIYLDDDLYCYNYETKQTRRIGKKNEFKYAEFIGVRYGGDVLYVRDGRLYLEVFEEKNDESMLYSVDIQTGKVEKLLSFPKDMEYAVNELFSANDNFVFFDCDDEKEVTHYICYDTGKKQETEIEEKDMISLLKEQNLWTKHSDSTYYISDCFDYEDRLYLVVNVAIKEKMVADCGPSKGETIEEYTYHTILLSCPWENISDLRYEEASEWIERNQSWEQQWMENTDCDTYSHYSMLQKLDIWDHCGDELLITDRKVAGKGDNKRLDYGLTGINLETGEARSIPKDSTLYQVFEAAKRNL